MTNRKYTFEDIDTEGISNGGLMMDDEAAPVKVPLSELLSAEGSWAGRPLTSVALDAKFSAIRDDEIKLIPCRTKGFYMLYVRDTQWGLIQNKANMK